MDIGVLAHAIVVVLDHEWWMRNRWKLLVGVLRTVGVQPRYRPGEYGGTSDVICVGLERTWAMSELPSSTYLA
jgi:hypothetical protein